MSSETFWLGRLAAFLCISSLVTLGALFLSDPQSRLSLSILEYQQALDKKLKFIRSKKSGRSIFLAQVTICALIVAASLSLGAGALLLFIAVIAFFPNVLLAKRVAERTTRFDDQIEGWLGAISNSLKASPSLGEAIASTIPLVPAPMTEEIDLLVKEHELGTPLDRALNNLAERLNTKTLYATVLTLTVARRSGGNLPEMLDSAAAALREMARLEGVVRTKTAEGRAQAWVIGAIPVPMIAGLTAIDPDFLDPLFASFGGKVVLAIAGVLWLFAILAAQKILAVDI